MKRLLVPFVLALCSFLAQAQTPLNFVGATVGGSTYEVCYYNDYLYAGCANTFRVYDLTGPNETPGIMHYEERFISNIDQILVHDGFLYVCANHAGLFKYTLADPANPVLVSFYTPADLDESIYDVAFYGDSLLVAAKRKLLVLEDGATSINYLSTYATYPGDSRIRGVDIKDSLLAYTVAYPLFNIYAGVYLVDLNSMTQLDFYLDNLNAALEVYFGQSTELLHVMGGQLSVTLDGRYYALDYSDPTSLNMVYADTIHGEALAGGSLSTPMSAVLINDTIYISTQGGETPGYTFPDPFSGRVFIYDATNPTNVHYLSDVYAGLYHFDADINPVNRNMYIASEWYGILSVNVSDIYSEVNYGKTITGGWCHGSTQKGDLLAEANEGFGVRLFNVADRSNPILIAQDTTVGFCRAIAFDTINDYLYGFFLTGKRFRVYDAATLTPVADTTIDPSLVLFNAVSHYQNARYYNGRIAVVEEYGAPTKRRVVTMDVSDPLNPFEEHYRQKNNIEHLLWLPDGNLMACAQDSLIIFDPASMSILSATIPPVSGQIFKGITRSGDTLYVFGSGISEGISRYYYDAAGDSVVYAGSTAYNMDGDNRILMATDDSLLYITSSLDSLRALEMLSPHNVVAVYNHGADFIRDNLWGVQDLYYNDGYLYLNEYMGQTTILNTLPFDDSGIEEFKVQKNRLLIYPNPGSSYTNIVIPKSGELVISTLNGQVLFSQKVNEGSLKIELDNYPAGCYIIQLRADSELFTNRLMIH